MKSYETESHNEAQSIEAHPANVAAEHEQVEVAQNIADQGSEEKTVEAGTEPAASAVPEDRQAVAGESQRQSQRIIVLAWPTWGQLRSWLPFWGVILLAAILRFWGLGDKPLHHDESLHAYYSLMLLKYNVHNWIGCFNGTLAPYCYRYDPLTHGPFQFHAIAFVYQISDLLGAPDHGVNTTTVRIAAATLGTVIVGLPYFLRDRLGTIGAWLACFLLAISPSLVYFSRFAREDIYMACFTLLLVVATSRYLSTRKVAWLVWAGVAFMLSYATKEATFLTIAVFGSFLGALIAWELGVKHAFLIQSRSTQRWRSYLPRTAAPSFVLLYFVVLAPLAAVFFELLKSLSIYITNPKNTHAADIFVQNLEDKTLLVVPWLGILLGIYVLTLLFKEASGKLSAQGHLAKRIDAKHQPLLYTIFATPWTSWFFTLLAAWAVFLVLFTVLFTNIRGGIADGIWRGIYYWLQQQQIARGGQPWYYYFLLIPLYEQIGVVFGLVGIVRSLLRPTRFRLFLVYWLVGNVFIYSWAAEKMPWLMIHMTMPMMLLAAIGLEPAVVTLVNTARGMLPSTTTSQPAIQAQPTDVTSVASRTPTRPASVGAAFTLLTALLLLLPTLQNMYQVSYIHAADGPHEMMVYVQTTTDVNSVMAKIAALDQKLYGGRHLVTVGVTEDGTWPFIWYLRDYANVCYDFPAGCPANGQNVQVIITGQDNLNAIASRYASGSSPAFAFHQYHMRTWWDEGYKPPDCASSTKSPCPSGYVGPGLWLSYGNTPPPNAQFNFGLAAQHIWQWWWQRKPFGSTDGTYDMSLLIRSDLHMAP